MQLGWLCAIAMRTGSRRFAVAKFGAGLALVLLLAWKLLEADHTSRVEGMTNAQAHDNQERSGEDNHE